MKTAKRLLNAIAPSHYELILEPTFEDFSFTAQEIITFKLKDPSRELEFHATDLDISEAKIGQAKAKSINFNKDDQSVTFTFDTEFPAGEHKLELAYRGPLREDMHGFYRSSYEHDGQEKWLATTQFEPTAAREAFVCIDEPAAKATFDISLVIPQDLTAVSNTNPVSETKSQASKTIKFATTPKMSPYLVAFLVGDFERVTATTKEGVEVGVYTTPGKAHQAQFALESAIKILSFYNDYFGIPYPLPKLDMAAIPDFAAGAMENWGLVTYRETAILVDPEATALANKQYVAMVVGHELAHQWFGNLVTMGWWTDLWLNEGFASWVEYLAVDHIYPEWEMWTQFVTDDYLRAQELDALANTHPIEVEVHHPNEIDEIFDAISYSKGASVIRMLYHYIGEDAFKAGLHNYLKHFSYGNAVTNDLWRFLEEASSLQVRRIMGAWTSQSGFPLVSIDNQGQIKQQRFFANPHEAKTDKTVWPIPFAFRTDDGQTEPMLFDKAESNLKLPAGQWAKPNPDQTAFFITHYSPGQIEALMDPLVHGKLPAIDRLGLISDVASLAQAGYLGGEQILKLLSALRNETDFAVWNSMLDALGQLFIISDEPMHDKLEVFARWLVQPQLARLGWEPQAGESHFTTLLRPRLIGLAGRTGDEAVIAESRRRFARHLEGELISADFRGTIYGVVARHGDEEDYEKLYKLYKTADLQEEARRILAALTAFHNVALSSRTLTMSLSKDVRSQDTVLVIARVLSNRVGRELAWKFIQANWDELVKRYGQGGHLLSYVPQSLGIFATHAKADEVTDFFATHQAPGIERNVRQAVERIRLQADWFERDQVKVNEFLNEALEKA